MNNNRSKCDEHSGCVARIENLEKNNLSQWEKIDKVDNKVNSIFTRVNIVLGGIVVACIMLVINLLIK